MKPIQYFSPDYLALCKAAQADDILKFLNDFRALHLSLSRVEGASAPGKPASEALVGGVVVVAPVLRRASLQRDEQQAPLVIQA